MKIKNTGFTLIELMVVIAIIGLLSSIVLASLNAARARARDTVRLSDMRQIRTALELYYDTNGQYPSDPASTQVANMNTGGADITPYISPIPTDPTNSGSQGYRYRISNVNGRQSFTMLVNLEKNSGNWCSVSVTPGHTNWNYSDGTNYPPC